MTIANFSVTVVMGQVWTIALLPLPALLIALSLPPTETDRLLAAADLDRARAESIA